MKIVISKKQWEEVGVKSGWMKKSDVTQAIQQEKIQTQPPPVAQTAPSDGEGGSPEVQSLLRLISTGFQTPQDYIDDILEKMRQVNNEESESPGISKQEYFVRESLRMSAFTEYRKQNNNKWSMHGFPELLRKIEKIEGTTIQSSKKTSLKAIAEKMAKTLLSNKKS